MRIGGDGRSGWTSFKKGWRVSIEDRIDDSVEERMEERIEERIGGNYMPRVCIRVRGSYQVLLFFPNLFLVSFWEDPPCQSLIFSQSARMLRARAQFQRQI